MLSISRFPVLIGVLLVLVISEVSAGMFGFGKKYDVFLCPEVKGSISIDGEPVEGLTIMREVIYDESQVDEVKTAEDGSFYFPPLKVRSSTPGKAFDETRTRQVLVTEYQGEQYVLWVYATPAIEEEPVISEKLSQLDCDLTDEKTQHHFVIPEQPNFTHNIVSICRWQ